MKKRLTGLLALVLCLIFTVAPVSGALADDFYYYSPENNYPSVQTGDLIASNTSLSNASSGGYAEYYNGLYAPDQESDDTEGCFFGVKIIEGTDAYEENLWAVAESSDFYLALERVGAFVDQVALNGSYTLIVMKGLQTVDSHPVSISERQSNLEKAAKDWNAQSNTVFYQMGVYEKNDPAEGVMRSVGSTAIHPAATIKLPYPSGYTKDNSTADDYALFHLREDGQVEKLDVTLEEDGISAAVKSFSPYALAYRPLTPKDDIDDGDDNNDGGNDDDGNDDGGNDDGGNDDGGNNDGGNGDGGNDDGDNNDGGNNDGGNGDGGNNGGDNDSGSSGSTSEDSSNGNGSDADKNNDAANLPKTGDNSNLACWVALAFMALAGSMYLVRRRKHI